MLNKQNNFDDYNAIQGALHAIKRVSLKHSYKILVQLSLKYKHTRRPCMLFVCLFGGLMSKSTSFRHIGTESALLAFTSTMRS